jgi:hypothetical protein
VSNSISTWDGWELNDCKHGMVLLLLKIIDHSSLTLIDLLLMQLFYLWCSFLVPEHNGRITLWDQLSSVKQMPTRLREYEILFASNTYDYVFVNIHATYQFLLLNSHKILLSIF